MNCKCNDPNQTETCHCQKRISTMTVIFDAASKTAISVRDGYQEYLGVELGINDQPDRVFKVYRSPDTIAKVRDAMKGIPVTNDHVDIDMPVPRELIAGYVTEGELVKTPLDMNGSAICIKSAIAVSDAIVSLIQSGKRELSLGYIAGLREHNGEYDFEQVDIEPHHLAIVERGRCGPVCTFTDQGANMKLHKAFLDAEGQPNLARIVEIAQSMPEAIKTMPIDELQKLIPVLEAALASANISGEPAETESATEVDAETDAEPDTKQEDMDPEAKQEDMDPEAKQEDMDPEVKQEDEEPEDEKKASYSDKAFADAVAKAAEKLASEKIAVIEKAKQFLPDTYSFVDKATAQIQRDALATQTSQPFKDAELATAFKLLKRINNYSNFADAGLHGKVDSIFSQEL